MCGSFACDRCPYGCIPTGAPAAKRIPEPAPAGRTGTHGKLGKTGKHGSVLLSQEEEGASVSFKDDDDEHPIVPNQIAGGSTLAERLPDVGDTGYAADPEARAVSPPAGKAVAGAPHIFMFLADDLLDGKHGIGFTGNTHVTTPTIDAFATNAIEFSRMYSTIAMCAPSRAAIFTGLQPFRNGVTRNHGFTPDSVTTLHERMLALGYTMVMGGKIHVRPDSKFPSGRYAQGEDASRTEGTTMQDFIDEKRGTDTSVWSFITKCSPGTSPCATKNVKKHCAGKTLDVTYTTLATARDACIAKGSACFGVYDSGCDRTGTIKLCDATKVARATLSTSGSSCVYEKPAGTATSQGIFVNGQELVVFYDRTITWGGKNEAACQWQCACKSGVSGCRNGYADATCAKHVWTAATKRCQLYRPSGKMQDTSPWCLVYDAVAIRYFAI